MNQSYDAWLWLTFLLIAMATHFPRGSFIVLGSRVSLPPALQRALRYAPAAALSAIIVPDLMLAGGELAAFNPKLLAGGIAVGAALYSRNPWLPFIAGMGALFLMRFGFGW